MKRLLISASVIFSIFCVCSAAAYAELTPPINGEGDDEVVGVASDDSEGDASVVDLSGKDTTQPVQSPSFENKTPSGMAPGGPIDN